MGKHFKRKTLGLKVKLYDGRLNKSYLKQVNWKADHVSEVNVQNRSPSPDVADGFLMSDSEPEEIEPAKGKSHKERQSKSALEWSKISDQLLEVHLTAMSDDDAGCFNCGSCIVNCAMRCLTCSQMQHYCAQCIKTSHEGSLFHHRVEIFKDGMYSPVTIPGFVDVTKRMQHASFCTLSRRKLVLVDSFGSQHEFIMQFCSCHSEAVQLLKAGFWPGSPVSPMTCFHLDFMEYLYSIQFECQVSIKKFWDAALYRTRYWSWSYRSDIYKVLLNCFPEYRNWRQSLAYGECLKLNLDNGTQCPACPVNCGVKAVSFDGCFALVRKRRGQHNDFEELLASNRFFEDQDVIDEFVDNYNKKLSKPELKSAKDCNNFHAGEVESSLRSKGKNSKLAEKGVLGTVCRHDYPGRFYSCFGGEKIAYAVYALMKLTNDVTNTSVKALFVYDIACLLEKHLKRSGGEHLMSNVTLALPAFHVYGHVMSCQLKYSPRRLEGFGLTDGEGTERLWSFLGEFARISKEMTPQHRTSLLDNALLHFAERKRWGLGAALVSRRKKSKACCEMTSSHIDAMLEKLPTVNRDMVKKWIDEEKFTLTKKAQDTNSRTQVPWNEEYVMKLHELSSLGVAASVSTASPSGNEENAEVIVAKMKSLSDSLLSIEQKHSILSRWKPGSDDYVASLTTLLKREQAELIADCRPLAYERFMLHNMKNKLGSGGQAVRKRLSNSLTVVTKKVKKRWRLFDSRAVSFGILSSCLPLQDLLDHSSPLYKEETTCRLEGTPGSIKRELMDGLMLELRCREELSILQDEIEASVKFYETEISRLDRALACTDADWFDSALKRMKKAKEMELWKFLKSTSSMRTAASEPQKSLLQPKLFAGPLQLSEFCGSDGTAASSDASSLACVSAEASSVIDYVEDECDDGSDHDDDGDSDGYCDQDDSDDAEDC